MTQLSKNPTKLIVNAAICDTRKIKAENYENYEAILINSDMMIVNDYSKGVLNRLQVSINSDNTIELSDGEADIDPEVKTVNGPYVITGDTVFAPHTLLKLNGPLTIEKGSEATLRSLEKIVLNGPMTYPRSLGGSLPQIAHNGPTIVYPDDCILLDHTFTVDQYFALRARENARYFVANTVIFSAEADIQTLAAKHVSFLTKLAVFHEDQVNTGVQLVDEKTELRVIPAGAFYVKDDTEINENLVKRGNGNLYIEGDAAFAKDADLTTLCPQIKKLVVKGKLTVSADQEEAFRKIPDVEAEELEFCGKSAKHRINDLATYYLDKQTVERYKEGIELTDIATLTIDPEIPVEMIYDRLTIWDIALIRCSSEQAGAIGAVSTDVAMIRGGKGGNSGKNSGNVQTNGLVGGIMNALFGASGVSSEDVEEDPEEQGENTATTEQNVRLINADKYVL
jgi:hypothetical protein